VRAACAWIFKCLLSTCRLLGWPCDHSQRSGLLQTSKLLRKPLMVMCPMSDDSTFQNPMTMTFVNMTRKFGVMIEWNRPSIIWSSVQNQVQSVCFCILTVRSPKTRVSEHKKALLMFDHNSKLACHVHECHHHMDCARVSRLHTCILHTLFEQLSV